ncbi:hypothetical protein [Streptomyces sp. YIM 132580]|uniref:hypothetical protein n=1 Tax=Streptomyces sp. YIM 132580 TaxID=2691958 RepID=UPI001F32A7A1|nr:hypothetical protein [Streptomyces sp. YIM 132580]
MTANLPRNQPRDQAPSALTRWHPPNATNAHTHNVTLPVLAAFEALKAAYTVARHEDGPDIDVYFEGAAQACSRLAAARRERVQQLEQGRARRAAATR